DDLILLKYSEMMPDRSIVFPNEVGQLICILRTFSQCSYYLGTACAASRSSDKPSQNILQRFRASVHPYRPNLTYRLSVPLLQCNVRCFLSSCASRGGTWARHSSPLCG